LLIISQNATNYNLDYPDDAVLRLNLAWCNSLGLIIKSLFLHPFKIFEPMFRIKQSILKRKVWEI